MRLRLIPVEGEKPPGNDEKLRQKRRTRPIPPETVNYFTEEQQQDIKRFLAKLVMIAEQFHHDMELVKQSPDNKR